MSNAACGQADPFEGRCLRCHAPTTDSGVHQRGRWREGPNAVPTIAWVDSSIQFLQRRLVDVHDAAAVREQNLRDGRAYADRIRATDLDDTICDCGRPLEGHPELPRPKPMGGWESKINVEVWADAREHTIASSPHTVQRQDRRWKAEQRAKYEETGRSERQRRFGTAPITPSHHPRSPKP